MSLHSTVPDMQEIMEAFQKHRSMKSFADKLPVGKQLSPE